MTSIVIGSWTFRAAGREEAWMEAKVPGCVHTDLLRNGNIEDPFYGTNEHRLQWIDKQDWEYAAEFDAAAEQLDDDFVQLVFEGLDTYADVTLNGSRLLSADNMFRIWKAEVKGLLKESGNKLHIRFRSPVNEDLPKLERLGYALPATNDQSELGGLGDKRISVFARKAPYHYGWDWGPRFVTSGIWRPVRLESWSGVRISELFIRQDAVSAEAAEVTAVVTVEAAASGPSTMVVTVEGREHRLEAELETGVQTLELPIRIEQPRLWWSRGLGEASLTEFQARVDKQDGAADSRTVRTGLRSVRLVRDRDEAGTSFYFELNGVAVFAKGANHIPNDSFVSEVTEDRYRHEILSAAEANMNMLRIWGGGIYEQDIFYDLCDEHGIMVWQDFMFACSMYPGDEAFLDNVRAEAEDNVRRLRNHPSIVLWCGNNEIDSAWAHYDENGGWGWKKDYTPEQRESIWADYEAIFHKLLPDAVERLSPGIGYWPSSPLISLTEDAGQHAFPESAAGDVHYWGVWHAVEPFENYKLKIGRFISEYGFQSFPEYRSVRSFAEEADMELLSTVMLAHQKNGAGNRLIKEYMDMYLPEPKDFPAFLYESQILQAEAMKMAIEAHRRRRPYCMGTLYWQMNDCWPVASWAGMDYFGRWKAMHYYAKRSFRDVLLSADRTGTGIDLHLVNDLQASLQGTLKVSLLDFSGLTLAEREVPAAAAGGQSRLLLSLAGEELLPESAASDSVLVTAELVAEDGSLLAAASAFLEGDRQLALAPASIHVEEIEGSGGSRFRVSASRLARAVWLQSDREGIFSDNFFDLVPGRPVTVAFKALKPGAVRYEAADAGRVTASSMADAVKALAAKG